MPLTPKQRLQAKQSRERMKKERERLERWRGKDDKGLGGGVVRRRVRLSGPGIEGPTCLLCLKPITILNSIPVKLMLGWAKVEVVNPSETGGGLGQPTYGPNPTEFLTPQGDLIHVDTKKDSSYPITKKGRVCDSCKGKVKEEDILAEVEHHLQEAHPDHSNLGFGTSRSDHLGGYLGKGRQVGAVVEVIREERGRVKESLSTSISSLERWLRGEEFKL